MSVCRLTLLIFALCIMTTPVSAQRPPPKNLQVFPKDTSRPELIQSMRRFSFALGVRCQHCHAGGDGVSFEGVVFESDEKPAKDKARFMMRMTQNLNRQVLPLVPQRDEPPVEITCKTCHRGQAKPMLLTQSMSRAMEADGAEAAVARYQELKKDFATSGSFDFGEWEVNSLAERLEREGRTKDAITIYELNRTVYPESMAIVSSLGRLYEAAGDTPAAIRMYERALELNPENNRAKERLEELRK